MQMRICWHPVNSVLQIRICVQPTINKIWENSTLQVLCPHPVILFKISCTQSSLSTPWIIFHDFHTKKKREEEDLWSSPLNLTKTDAGAGLSLMSGQLTMVAIHLKEHNPGRTLRKKNWKQSGLQRGVPHTRKFHCSSKQHTKHSLDTPRHDGKNQQLLSAAIYRSAVTQPTMHFLCEFHPRGKKKLFSQV